MNASNQAMQLTASKPVVPLGVSAVESVCCVACAEGSRQLILCLVRCNPMPKFRAFIHGVNFHVHLSDSDTVKPHGFYVNAFIEAESPEKAELVAIELIRKSPQLDGTVHNSANDPPRMFVEEIQEIADWPPDTVRPLTGFALYDEEAEQNP